MDCFYEEWVRGLLPPGAVWILPVEGFYVTVRTMGRYRPFTIVTT